MSLLRELQCDVLDSSNVENNVSISTGQVATSNGGLTLNNPGPANAPVFSSQLFANLDVNNKGELIVSGDNIVNLNAYALPGVPTTTAGTPALVVNVVSGAGIVGKYYLPLWTL
jgi:hypothetical protein